MTVGLMAFALIVGAVQGAQEEPLELSLLRTRAAAGVTAIDAVAEMDPRWLFDADRCTYGVEVVVSDSTGAEVVRESWRRPADCSLFRNDPEVRVIDTFSFAVRPGRYTVEMIVTSASGESERSARIPVTGLPRDARASDLYLAREVGWTDSASAGGWAIRKGRLGIAAEAVLQVPATRPFLGYYLELYVPGEPLTNGTVQARIRRQAGGNVAEFTLQQIERLDADRPIAGTVSLAGLPPGEYELDVVVRFDGRSELVRGGRFELVRRAAETPRADAPARPDELRAYFDRLPDEDLPRFDAVAIWLASDDARRTLRSLSPQGKRQFLVDFFQRAALPVSPSETATGADALRLYLERLRQVEREFTERTGGEGSLAWQTDRGRLVMLRGMPDDRIRRPMPANDSRPYEIWYYNIGSGYVYLFADESGFGHYRLLYSTDPSVVTLPDWARRAGPAAVSELSTYYGVRETF